MTEKLDIEFELKRYEIEDILNGMHAPLLIEDDRDIQERWDEWLCWCFINKPNIHIKIVSYYFSCAARLFKNEIDKLSRTPQQEFQSKTCVTRFVSGYIPDLAEKLWNYNKSENSFDEILKFINKKNPQTINQEISSSKRKDEFLKRSAKSLEKKSRNEYYIAKNLNDKCSRSGQWSTNK